MKQVSLLEYNRQKFGHGWRQEDCLTTRQRILIRDSLEDVIWDDENNVIVEGKWHCPYTDKIIMNPSNIDIDHIVTLKEAYEKGAAAWSYDKKVDFANYEKNLLAVSAKSNRKKGSKHPKKWLPKNNTFREKYIEKWIKIKDKFNLRLRDKIKELKNKINNNT